MQRLIVGILLGCASLVAADVKLDNDAVRVLKALQPPHQKTPLHEHALNRVMVYLDAAQITVIYEDSRVENQHWAQDEVAWSVAGGRHTSENVGNVPIRIVEIELKEPAPQTPPVRSPQLDPIAIDPLHNKLLFENGQVRVFRSWREPGGTELMHEHTGTGRVAVLLTDAKAIVKQSDGSTSEFKGSAGDVFWSGPITHATTNLSTTKLDMIIVEVK
jgi:hypothetical protein